MGWYRRSRARCEKEISAAFQCLTQILTADLTTDLGHTLHDGKAEKDDAAPLAAWRGTTAAARAKRTGTLEHSPLPRAESFFDNWHTP